MEIPQLCADAVIDMAAPAPQLRSREDNRIQVLLVRIFVTDHVIQVNVDTVMFLDNACVTSHVSWYARVPFGMLVSNQYLVADRESRGNQCIKFIAVVRH